MKKLFMIGALISVVASSTMVFAQTKSMEVSYTVEGKYTLTIPADLILTKETPVAQAVSVTDARLASQQNLTVKMESANYTDDADKAYHVVYDSDSTIAYSVKKGETEADISTEVTVNNAELISISAGQTEETLYMTFTTTQENIDKATKAGKHVDTLTFTAEIK